MGDLIYLDRCRARRAQASAPPAYYFDVASPLTYLAAERVERSLGQIEWVAIDASALPDEPATAPEQQALRARAELHAEALRVPLVWPEPFAAAGARARRAAAFACEVGGGARFALAAGRLAYCGGFDLDDPETLAEAAAASGVPLDGCLEAATERSRDDELREIAGKLRGLGVRESPVIFVGERWFTGVGVLLAAGAELRTSLGT